MKASTKSLLLYLGWWALIAALVLAVVWACEPARAEPIASLKVTAADDSMRVTVKGIALPQPVDSATLSVTAMGVVQRRTLSLLATSAVFTFPAPAEGASTTITASLTAWHDGLSKTFTKTLSYTRPVIAVPPGSPSIDSITVEILSQLVWPDSGSIALLRQVASRAVPAGAVSVVRTDGEACVGEWAYWNYFGTYGGGALLIRPTADTPAACDPVFYSDPFPNGVAASNWRELRTYAPSYIERRDYERARAG